MSINYNKIFQLFSDENMKDSKSPSTDYKELRNHPVYFLGMFKKMINHKPMSEDKAVAYLKDKSLDIDPKDMVRAGIRIIYDKSWLYLSKFNIEDTKHLKELELYSDDELLDALSLGIKYFEISTEFERCAFMKKIHDKIVSFKNN